MNNDIGGYKLITISDEYLLVPVGIEVIKRKGIISINESAAFLWNEMCIDNDIDRLVKVLKDKYNLDSKIAMNNVTTFIDKLKSANINIVT